MKTADAEMLQLQCLDDDAGYRGRPLLHGSVGCRHESEEASNYLFKDFAWDL